MKCLSNVTVMAFSDSVLQLIALLYMAVVTAVTYSDLTASSESVRFVHSLVDSHDQQSSLSAHQLVLDYNNHGNTTDTLLYVDEFTDSTQEVPVYNYRKRRQTRGNLCEQECDCRMGTKGLVVNCDLYKNLEYIFGSNKYIPRLATSLLIKLAPNARLRLDQNFFYQNRVNRVFIEGTPQGGSEHIEVRPNAMRGNNAPFPDIEIVNCHEVILRGNAFIGEFKFNVSNCHDVILYSNAFYNTSFYGHFNDIVDLRIHEEAFNNAKAKLNINHSRIENLYRFAASLREIRFFNCTIGSVNPGTFDVININSIIFEQCKIDVFKSRAITEKLFSHHLAITEAIIGVIENEAIAGSGISELLLSKNEIDTIQNNAIYVTAINATIIENSIKHVGKDWFRVKDWTNITISNNKFGDFDLLQLDKTANPVHCVFHGNFITNPKPGSLNITNQLCIIRQTSFYQPCTCNISWLTSLTDRDLRSESYCRVDDTLKFCFNTSIFNVLKYQDEVCDYTQDKIVCTENRNLKKIVGDFLKPEELEKGSDKTKLIYILSGIFVLIIVFVIVFVVAYKCAKRRRMILPPSEISIAASNGTLLKDLRTFSNDDKVIINQTLDIMKQKYDPHVYQEVYKNTQILLQGNLTETQRVKTIGDIVQILGECENSGEDFVALTDILYRHLAPTGANPGDPVYAEPTNPMLHDRVMDNVSLNDGQTNIDHIYAEPNSVQQPLLTNEYASPADRNEIIGLYTEPIATNREMPKFIPHYAIAQPKENMNNNSAVRPRPQLQQPSTSKNLPDVLSASKPMTNVQKLAQNFASNPNFHITRSPHTNRKIPKYTIPNVRGKSSATGADKDEYFGAAIPGSSSGYGAAGSSSGNNNGASSTSDNRSDHSGGSDITVKIDDIIEYADA